MPIVNNAISRAQNTMKNALGRVSGQVGSAMTPAQRRRLSSREQLDRFLAMSEADFETLSQARGPGEVQRFTEAMMRLARRGA